MLVVQGDTGSYRLAGDVSMVPAAAAATEEVKELLSMERAKKRVRGYAVR
jgi:hypothetical protein